MKTFLSVLIMHLSVAALCAQAKQEMPTTITHVTVFNSGAQVKRTGQLDINKGKTSIRIIGLTPDLDPKSIQVRANEEVSILAVAHEWNTSSKANNSQAMDSLQSVLKSIDQHTRYLMMRRDVLARKVKLLDANETLGSATASVNIHQLEEALLLYDSVHMEANAENLRITRQLDSMQMLQKAIDIQLYGIRGTPMVSKSEIELLVHTEVATTIRIDLSYIVKHAGWIPRYDIRANDITQPIVIVYKAEVYQHTGEVWKDVKLSFSNASPYARQAAPTLEPWRLTTMAKTTFRRIGIAEYTYGIRNITGRVVDESGEPLIYANVQVPGHLIGIQTDLNGDFTIVVPQDVRMLNVSYTGYDSQTIPITETDLHVVMKSGLLLETATIAGSRKNVANYYIDGINVRNGPAPRDQLTVVVKNQVSVAFELDYLATVLSDGKSTSHEMQTYEIEAGYYYETVPKADPGAYLVATLTQWEKYHLLEGMANLYFKNTYIGKTLLDPQSMSDTLEISLGRDPEVLVEREQAEVHTRKTFLGANATVDKTYTIRLRNKKSAPVQVRVIDQIPLSVNDAVTITVGELTGGKHELLSGRVQWNLNLAPTSGQEIRLGYTVKFPAKERVFLD
jgi:hypothetical protein